MTDLKSIRIDHIKDGLASVVRGLIALFFIQLYLVFTFQDEFVSSGTSGEPVTKIEIVDLSIPESASPIVCLLLLFVLLSVVKSFAGLRQVLSTSTLDVDEKRQLLVHKPTMFNPFFPVDGSLVSILTALQLSVFTFLLFLLPEISIGSYLKEPDLWSGSISFAFVFFAPAVMVVYLYLSCLHQIGVADRAIWFLLTGCGLIIVFSIAFFYLFVPVMP